MEQEDLFDVICDRCKKPGEIDGCPYQEDVGGMKTEDCLCNCCSDCRYECAMDI